jgi:TIR domain/Pentapeptide repeats (8 copies)
MANEEQLSILKQGVQVWNKWRNENFIDTDFTNPSLQWKGKILVGYRKSVDLRQADLSGADLRGADLREADLSGAKLWRADLKAANLSETNLTGADLREVDCNGVEFDTTNFFQADLSGANLSWANFRYGQFHGANFAGATLGFSVFSSLDLREAMALDKIVYLSPSEVSISTLAKSQGKIPEVFLRGCGLSDWEIEQAKLHNPDLSNEEFIDIQNRVFVLRNRYAIQISPLFISYSHADGDFVNKLDKQLNAKGIRFWRDIHDLKAGRIERQIDQAISQDRTVLLVLSERSLKSDWVEHEVRKAREIATNTGRDTLCPVALDDSWKDSRWPQRVMEQIMEYNILDFSAWQDDSKFDDMFRRLIDGLELFYKG